MSHLKQVNGLGARIGGRRLFQSLVVPLAEAIREEQLYLLDREPGYQAFFASLEPGVLALITLQELTTLALRAGDEREDCYFTQVKALEAVAQEVELECKMQNVLLSKKKGQHHKMSARMLKQRARKMKAVTEMGSRKVAEIVMQILKKQRKRLQVHIVDADEVCAAPVQCLAGRRHYAGTMCQPKLSFRLHRTQQHRRLPH